MDFFPDQGVWNYEFIPFGITSIRGLELEIWIRQDGYVSSVDRFENLQSFGHNSLYMQPKLMNFGQNETYEIPELLQLDLPQSEVHNLSQQSLQILIAPMFRA
jgi:hypothetical protein